MIVAEYFFELAVCGSVCGLETAGFFWLLLLLCPTQKPIKLYDIP
jgi:hypothetical protein